MNSFKTLIFQNFRIFTHISKNTSVSNFNVLRYFCHDSPRISLEKSVNHVVLIGRVGINPQLRGTEIKPVVVFTLATNTNYKYESGEVHQKTDWHRISVFKPYLRNLVMEHLKKGARVYIEGRILYGEFSDNKGVTHNTTSIVANDLIFIGGQRREEIDSEESADVM